MSDSILMNNKLLLAVEQKVEAGLSPQVKRDYLKIVVAGMHAAMAKQHDGILASLQHSKNPVSDCAIGALNLCGLLFKQSRGTMPLKAMVPAAMTLMLHALDFADRMGLVKVDNDVVDHATHIFTNHMFKMLHLSPEQLHTAAANLQKIASDPTSMEAMRRKAGLVKDPNASSPTEVMEK